MSDWENVPRDVIYKLKGQKVLQRHGGYQAFLSRFLPDKISEITTKGLKTTHVQGARSSKMQHAVLSVVKQLFSESKIVLNYKLADAFYATRNHWSLEIELDIYIEEFDIGFEYHGEQHYHWARKTGSPFDRRLRDQERKQVRCFLRFLQSHSEMYTSLDSGMRQDGNHVD